MSDDPTATTREAAQVRAGVVLDHLAPTHELPVSNGWTTYGGQVAVWCGWCRHLYAADAAWAQRYLAARWHHLAKSAASATTRVSWDYARRKITDLAGALREAGVPVTWTRP